MSSVLRSVAVFSFISAIALISAPGCSQQAEGERCDRTKNGDLDCDDGLICVASGQLLDKTADRCCPVNETDRTGLCRPSGVDTDSPDPVDMTSGGAGGAGGAAAPDTAGGASAGQNTGGVPGSSGSGTNGGVPSVDGGAPAAGASTGGAGSPSSAGQGGAG